MATNRKKPGISEPAQATAPDADSYGDEGAAVDKPEASPEERAQLQRWLDTIESEKNLHKDFWRQIRRNRNAAAGESTCDVHVNLHQASLETLLPILYAQDPEVQVKPAQSVGQQRYTAVKAFAQTLQIVVQRELSDAGLKTTSERAIRAAKVSSFGVVKVSFQTDSEDDPGIVHRINDAHDQLQRIAALTEDINEGCDYEDIDAKRKDLQDTILSLQAKVEVLKSIGVVLDVFSADDFIVPHDVSELLDYASAPWLAQRIWMRQDAAKEKFSLSDEECGMLTTYADRDAALQSDDNDTSGTPKQIGEKKGENTKLVAVWEIWDPRAGVFYTVIEGLCTRYAKPAVTPKFTGRRFYSFFLLAFAWVDGKREPLSAVEMADPLVEEYNRTRSGYREHRENSIPATIFDSSTLSQPDVERIKNRKRIENIAIDGNGQPLGNAFHVLEYPAVDAALYDTQVIRGELDVIYGVQDAMRGQVQQPKTATEAGIMQQGLSSRTSGQRTALETWLQDIAKYTSEVLLTAMPKQQALEIAGEGAEWPTLSRSQIQNDVLVEIRAGSTGKPDKQQDVQNWQEISETLLNMLEKYVGALQNGQQGLADAYKAIFAETLRRLDERLDPETFLPKVTPQPPPQPPPQPLPETALTGPQVQAMQGIVASVQGGALQPDVATALIQACFPHVTQPLIEALVRGPAQTLAGAAGVPAMPGAPAPTQPAGGDPVGAAPGAPAPGGLPHPSVVAEALQLAKQNPEVGKAVHAAVESMKANGGKTPTPPPPG